MSLLFEQCTDVHNWGLCLLCCNVSHAEVFCLWQCNACV